MALQSPFFNNNKRDVPGDAPATGSRAASPILASHVAAQTAQAQTVAATPVPAAISAPAAVQESESRLTVGPNIKLKGVEITDCDTLVVEGSVEATMDSRVIQIAERGSFKGSAEIDIAEIRGHFDGNLTVREKLTIFATGKVTGRIRYGKVVIEEGGQLSGEVEFGTAPKATATLPARPLQQVNG
ncbi:polymer-forming cytoskeletal protein [Ramlibacter sp. AN1015]|uniref:bactofilin family protein n=1 Tax=Ramlibacter sp. AN1015 TaxID=3133428 RepID=UPI0030C24274